MASMEMKRASLLVAMGLTWAIPNVLLGQDTAALLDQHRERAEQALRADDRPTAEREFRAMLALAPHDSKTLTGLGVLLYGEGKAEEAVANLRQALDVDPTAQRAELFLGLSEADLGDCAKANPILSKYFASEPAGKLQRLTGLAFLACASSQTDPLPAVQVAANLNKQYPGDADVLFESAELYTRLWNQSAGELLAKHPDSYRVHQLAAEVYEAQNNYDQAIREYRLALVTNPQLPQMHFRIGQLYLRQGAADADDKAMQEFRQEKAIHPDSAVSDLAMAEIERHGHQLDQAKLHYQEAARLDPQLVEARVGLAQTLLAQRQTEAAATELQAVLAAHPENAQAHYAMMLAYREQGKMPQAAAEMAQFQQLQKAHDQNFQSKLDALLGTKQTSGGAAEK
jgi:tetratricopeptide (TPR) repeat protein